MKHRQSVTKISQKINNNISFPQYDVGRCGLAASLFFISFKKANNPFI